jgi:hypothetical protein
MILLTGRASSEVRTGKSSLNFVRVSPRFADCTGANTLTGNGFQFQSFTVLFHPGICMRASAATALSRICRALTHRYFDRSECTETSPARLRDPCIAFGTAARHSSRIDGGKPQT